MEISHSPWPWLRSDATALAGYAKMMMIMMNSHHPEQCSHRIYGKNEPKLKRKSKDDHLTVIAAYEFIYEYTVNSTAQ